jgi:hypothetical protein
MAAWPTNDGLESLSALNAAPDGDIDEESKEVLGALCWRLQPWPLIAQTAVDWALRRPHLELDHG